MAQGVDPTSDRPVYKQIADLLRSSIERGELRPGERLPSETELIKRFGVAQGTVRQAVGLLRSEGVVIAEHGRGVFVRSRPRLRRLAHDRFARRHRQAGKAAYIAESEAENVTYDVDNIRVFTDKASADIAKRLGLRKGFAGPRSISTPGRFESRTHSSTSVASCGSPARRPTGRGGRSRCPRCASTS
ncbi:regulatory GntR family protein [Thermasporomyces composti]|uniref:Regulatory GntR family protein n=1 Tax=Thermasporomyces composti TaxID=696763 RepID=A0A3D9V7V0_THECX|nr:regulatory GntR family protein [Thermasporomyces composti]